MKKSQKIWAVVYAVLVWFTVGFLSGSWEIGFIAGVGVFNSAILMALTAESY